MNDASTGAWREALDCVDGLLSQPHEERNRYLSELQQSRPDLHARVHALLKADRDASRVGFMNVGEVERSSLKVNGKLGPYRLERELGQGGMGEVWLARRDDGLYEGEVAIKTLHPYFAGGAMRERFLREAQLLGRLAHPNIARLLDAGVSDGAVYIVLEYVRGQPIDKWCDEKRLSIEERLRLFLDVCAAVAHAHAHLIVHRDIKPSNILVMEAGQNVGAVKLLDFGIAKLVETETGEATELTRLGGRIFTPDYAAPEQIMGKAVTVATDVYSLGVLLYALLNGGRPYAAGSPRELERAVLETDPRALQHLDADSEKLARERNTTAAKLGRDLSGDLAVIVGKALRKNPLDRYGTVEALAGDVERFLNREPVAARTGSRAYRIGRFIARHRLAVAAGAGMAVAAAAGIVGILWQANEARAQARIAQVEAQKANAVKDFLLGIFNTNSADNPDGVRARQTTAEELLAIGSKNILQSSMDPTIRIELLSTLGDLNSLLQQYDRAEALRRERVALATDRFGPSSPELAGALIDLSQLQRQREQFDAARDSVERAVSILDTRGETDSILRGRAEAQRGHIAYMVGDIGSTAALDHFRQAVRTLQRHPPSRDRFDVELGYAMALESLGKFDEAIASIRSAIDSSQTVFGPRSVEIAGAQAQLARVLMQADRLDEAQAHIDTATEIFLFAVGEDSGLTGSALLDAGRIAIRRAKHRDAVTKLERALQARLRTDGPLDPWVQEMRFALAFASFTVGDWDRCEQLIVEALAALEKFPRREVQVTLLHVRAMLNRERGRIDASLADMDTATKLAQHPAPIPGYTETTTHVLRLESLIAGKRFAQAKAELAKVEPAIQKMPATPPRASKVRAELARVAIDMAGGNLDQAVANAQSLAAVFAQLSRREEYWELEALTQERLGEALLAAGRRTDGCRAIEAARQLRLANGLPIDPRIRRLESHSRICTAL